MRPPAEQLSIINICEGCKLIHHGEIGIVFGVPNEVRKFIDNAGFCDMKVPAYVAPDTPHANGLSYWRYEFPGFTKMFKEGGYQKGEKLSIIGDREQIKYGKIIVRSSLMSLTDEELEIGKNRFGVTDKEISEWKKIIDFFSLRSLDGNKIPLQINDLYNFIEFDNTKPVYIDKFWVRKERELNTFTVGHVNYGHITFSLSFSLRPKPPYRIEVSDAFQEKFLLGGIPFSYGNGFDARNGNTNWLLKINGTEILWDVGSFIWDHLIANGYGPQRVFNLYITHSHEDHVGAMLGAIYFGGHFNIYGTPLVLVSTMVNFFANLKWDINDDKYWKLISQYFKFYPLPENKTQSLFGADFTPIRSYHTVPTAGALIEVQDDSHNYSMYITSDITGLKKMSEMHDAGVISDIDYEQAVGLLEAPHTLKICDGGGDAGEIHMNPFDWQSIASQPKCVDTKFVVGHRNELPPSCHRLTLAEAGKAYVACYGTCLNTDSTIFADAIRTIGVHDFAQIEVLWHQSETVKYGSRFRILEQGEATDAVYVVLAGTLEVMVQNDAKIEKRLAILQAGDYFGEMACLHHTTRNASIRSISPVRLQKFPGDSFARFVRENGLKSKLEKIWSKRHIIAKMSYFQCLSVQDLKKLASESQLIAMAGGKTLIQEGTKSDSVYGIVSGHVNVYRTINGVKELINVLGTGAVIGETVGLTEAKTRNATIEVRDDSTFIRFEGDDFRRWAGTRFGLYIGLKTMIDERKMVEKYRV